MFNIYYKEFLFTLTCDDLMSEFIVLSILNMMIWQEAFSEGSRTSAVIHSINWFCFVIVIILF